jgi:hydroxypyruvate isomerase
MPKFAANLSMLFTEQPFLDRFERAAKAGFTAVEFLFPYAFAAADIRSRLDANRLQLVLHNLPAGDWDAGERGIACLPDRKGEFQDGVGQAIDYATALGCRQVNCLAGKRPAGVADTVLGDTLVDNLRFAAKALGEAGITLLVEPINTRDIPGFFLSGSQQTLDLLDAVEAPNTKLQYDIYHMQIMEGDLGPTLQALMSRIGHIQVADNPGRHEPGTGEIHHPFLFRLLDALGYAGWVGAEYVPQAGTEAGLGWFAPYRVRATVAA